MCWVCCRQLHVSGVTGARLANRQPSVVAAVQGSLLSMHTPAVLTFLHLLAAAAVQLVLAANGVLPTPQVSSGAAKGALVAAATSSLQVCVRDAVSCVQTLLLLCCITPSSSSCSST